MSRHEGWQPKAGVGGASLDNPPKAKHPPLHTIPDWLLEAAEEEVLAIAQSNYVKYKVYSVKLQAAEIARAVIDLCIQEGFDPWKAAERHEGKY